MSTTPITNPPLDPTPLPPPPPPPADGGIPQTSTNQPAPPPDTAVDWMTMNWTTAPTLPTTPASGGTSTGASPYSQPTAADITVSPGTIRDVEQAGLDFAGPVVTQYDNLEQKVQNPPAGLWGEKQVNMNPATPALFGFPTDLAFGAMKFKEEIIPLQDNALKQVTGAMSVLNMFIKALGTAASAYVQTDLTCRILYS